MSELILDVTGMTCVNCERLVESELSGLPDVDGVMANASRDVVQVEAPPTAADDVLERIDDLGFGVET